MEKSLAMIAAACEVWLKQQMESGQAVKEEVEAKKEAFYAELTKPTVKP